MLREGRAWAAGCIADWVARNPDREAPFIRIGRSADRSSYALGTLYTHAIQRLVGRLRERGNVFRPLQCGSLSLLLDITDHSALHEYFYGPAHRYEAALVDYLATRLRPGDVFVDVGANAGFFSLIAARLVAPTGRVVAFEPHPDARAALSRLLDVNGAGDLVDIQDAALAEKSGAGMLYLSDDSVLSTLVPDRSPAREHFAFDRAIPITLETLDGWLARRPDLARRVTVIKIDVEGAEDRVLSGMERLLSQTAAVRVVCETTPDSAAERRLRALGFRPRLLDRYHGEFGNYAYERDCPEPGGARGGNFG